ncbi:MAG: dCTP deaminase [Candidatus Pacebacteria bacterium]|nr:dCTP deaminase [Candidatus Paceibacterota bacterium]
MILSDKDIKDYIAKGKIKISPSPDFETQLGPCSLDLRLGDSFKVFKQSRYPYIDLKRPFDVDNIMEDIVIAPDSPFILQPGEFILAVTMEDVLLGSDLMARLDGRSSLGRLGVVVHSTAARFDPGWNGKPVMELGNLGVMPVVLYSGMRICALTFETLSSPCENTYQTKKNAKYAKQEKATASKISEEFKLHHQLQPTEIKEIQQTNVNLNSWPTSNASSVANAGWPVVEGRFYVGNKNSPVAVCTNATVEGIELDMAKVAICGKCVTENIGIEKIIQNIIANPNIRFLLLCGKPSKGHYVEQAIMALKQNGVDKEKTIIGAVGNMPHLKGLDTEVIERFRAQVEPINLNGETSSASIMQIVEQCLAQNPGPFNGTEIKVEKPEEIEATGPFDWVEDPNGFFVVSLRPSQKKIVVEHLQNHKITKKVVGDSALDICYKIGQMQMVGNFEQTVEHAMYLGRELQKAELCLKNQLAYEQDGEIEMLKERVLPTVEKAVKENIYGWHD